MNGWGLMLIAAALVVGYFWGAWKATGRELEAILRADRLQDHADRTGVENAQLRRDLTSALNERLERS